MNGTTSFRRTGLLVLAALLAATGADASTLYWTLRDENGRPLRELETEISSTGEQKWRWRRDYIRTPSGFAVAMSEADGNRTDNLVLHPDHLGSPRVISRGASAVGRATYFPFGEAVESGHEPGIGFTGHEEDEGTGLYNMGARLYNPGLGRFLSPDPVVGDQWNRYAYVANDPLGKIDLDGRQQECEPLATISAHRSTFQEWLLYDLLIEKLGMNPPWVPMSPGSENTRGDFGAMQSVGLLALMGGARGGSQNGLQGRADFAANIDAMYVANGRAPVTVIGRGMRNVEAAARHGGNRVQTIANRDAAFGLRWSRDTAASYQTHFNQSLKSGNQVVGVVNMEGHLASPSQFFASELHWLSRNPGAVVVPLRLPGSSPGPLLPVGVGSRPPGSGCQ